MTLIVGAHPAGIVKGLPLVSITPESFTMIDEAGNRYPVVASEELYREYGRTDVERRGRGSD